MSCLQYWKLGSFQSSIEGVQVFASLRYNSIASHILLAAKEDGIKQADDLILSTLQNSLNNLRAAGMKKATLVPVPSTAQANRKRGRNFVLHLAERLSNIEALAVWELLDHARKIQDQAGLTFEQRQRNLHGSMKISNQAKLGRPVILVDDLMTTGATLGEAVKTLQAGGVPVAAAITAFLALPIR